MLKKGAKLLIQNTHDSFVSASNGSYSQHPRPPTPGTQCAFSNPRLIRVDHRLDDKLWLAVRAWQSWINLLYKNPPYNRWAKLHYHITTPAERATKRDKLPVNIKEQYYRTNWMIVGNQTKNAENNTHKKYRGIQTSDAHIFNEVHANI